MACISPGARRTQARRGAYWPVVSDKQRSQPEPHAGIVSWFQGQSARQRCERQLVANDHPAPKHQSAGLFPGRFLAVQDPDRVIDWRVVGQKPGQRHGGVRRAQQASECVCLAGLKVDRAVLRISSSRGWTFSCRWPPLSMSWSAPTWRKTRPIGTVVTTSELFRNRKTGTPMARPNAASPTRGEPYV